MRAVKFAFVLAGLLAVFRYIPAYYYASEFENFVQNEVQRTRIKGQVRRDILDKAKIYSLRLNDDDINITTTGAVFRVAVDYQVPVDLFVYSHKLKFHTIGAGLSID